MKKKASRLNCKRKKIAIQRLRQFQLIVYWSEVIEFGWYSLFCICWCHMWIAEKLTIDRMWIITQWLFHVTPCKWAEILFQFANNNAVAIHLFNIQHREWACESNANIANTIRNQLPKGNNFSWLNLHLF